MPKAKTPQERKASAEKAAVTRARNRDMKQDLAVKNVLKNEEAVEIASEETQAAERAGEPDPVMKTDNKPAEQDEGYIEQDNNPAPNNGMSVNKPLTEYTASEVVKREATPEEEAASVDEDEEPRRLIIGQGPGNLMVIKWNRGGGRVPKNCEGGWNNKIRAQGAIDAAYALPDNAE